MFKIGDTRGCNLILPQVFSISIIYYFKIIYVYYNICT